MFFNSGIFLISFLGFFGIYHAQPWNRNTRVLLVFVASILFYLLSDSHHLPLLAALITIHYLAGKNGKGGKHILLFLVILMDIAILAYFKFYRNDLRLPLGLSFYIFQCLAYVIDILYGRRNTALSAIEFAGSVAYFPHLPSGPLLRSKDLHETFQAKVSWEDCKTGFFFLTLGFTKKTIADLLAPLTDAYLHYGASTAYESWTGALAGLARIYGDFSGYTDMASGLSILLGFKLPINFFRPFTAQSMRSFYSERWHISLASWIREYLYVPIALAFSRRRIPAELGIMVSFLVMSLWHGANFTFLIWGSYIALTIILEDKVRFRTGSVGIIRTNLMVMLGLIFFYSRDMSAGLGTLIGMINVRGEFTGNILTEFILTLTALGTLVGLSFLDSHSLPRFVHSKVLWPMIFILSAFSFILGQAGRNFIYYDF